MITLNGTNGTSERDGNGTGLSPVDRSVPENGTDSKVRGEPARTKKLHKTLPRGIKIGEWKDDRTKRFKVRFSANGKRSVESFESEQARNDRAVALAQLLEDEGSQALAYSPVEWRAWCALKAETGATIPQLREAWNRYAPTLGCTILTKTAVEKYLILRTNEDIKEKSNTYRQMRKHLRFLSAAFGDMRLADVTTEELRKLLKTVPDRSGKKGEAVPETKKNYRKNWNAFFNRALVIEHWIQSNPCSGVIPPSWTEEDQELISIKDAFQFLKANLDNPVTPRIALEMFGFLRASSVGRIKKERVNFEERYIVMPGRSHKSGRRKARTGHSDVLWDWLALATDETWEIGEVMYTRRKSEAFIRAGLVNPGNVFRHSCISYFVAAEQEFETASYLAQHAKISQTEDYEGMATERDGILWHKLTPQAVAGTWEDFLAANPHVPKSPKAANE